MSTYYLDDNAYGDATLWRGNPDDPRPAPVACRHECDTETWNLLLRGAGLHEDPRVAELKAAASNEADQRYQNWTDLRTATDHIKHLEVEKDRDNRHHQQEYTALSNAYDDLERERNEMAARWRAARTENSNRRVEIDVLKLDAERLKRELDELRQRAEVAEDERTWLRTELDGVIERAENAEASLPDATNMIRRATGGQSVTFTIEAPEGYRIVGDLTGKDGATLEPTEDTPDTNEGNDK